MTSEGGKHSNVRAPQLIGLGEAARHNPYICVGTGARIWIFRGARHINATVQPQPVESHPIAIIRGVSLNREPSQKIGKLHRQRHAQPRKLADLDRLMQLTGGHPFLSHLFIVPFIY